MCLRLRPCGSREGSEKAEGWGESEEEHKKARPLFGTPKLTGKRL